MEVTAPRLELAALPTPLVRAQRLEAALGAGPVYVKRDDLTGFGLAGNKARPLEFLIGAALATGSDVFVAAGSPSSNFCAAAAMAARAAGLDCDLLFAGPPPPVTSATVELSRTVGARLLFDVVPEREELDDAVVRHAGALREQGRLPYAVPRGGATGAGALGYFVAAQELAEQCTRAGIVAGTVVVPTGSGATLAGLVAGRAALGRPWRVVGASVSRDPAGLAGHVLRISRACAATAGSCQPEAGDIDIRDARGRGFGVASPEDRVSAGLALRHEGLLLDDYYGAKAMTVLRTLLADGIPTPAVFWHTGGVSSALTALLREAS